MAESYEANVQKFQEGTQSLLEFVLNSEDKQDFLDWCKIRRISPNNTSAGFYLDYQEELAMNAQYGECAYING